MVLNSWKEIATYLGRGVRTVQRWEHIQSLPVHHMGTGTHAAVFAYADELDLWLHEQRIASEQITCVTALRAESRKICKETRSLVTTLRNEVSEIKESVRHGREVYESHAWDRKSLSKH